MLMFALLLERGIQSKLKHMLWRLIWTPIQLAGVALSFYAYGNRSIVLILIGIEIVMLVCDTIIERVKDVAAKNN